MPSSNRSETVRDLVADDALLPARAFEVAVLRLALDRVPGRRGRLPALPRLPVLEHKVGVVLLGVAVCLHPHLQEDRGRERPTEHALVRQRDVADPQAAVRVGAEAKLADTSGLCRGRQVDPVRLSRQRPDVADLRLVAVALALDVRIEELDPGPGPTVTDARHPCRLRGDDGSVTSGPPALAAGLTVRATSSTTPPARPTTRVRLSRPGPDVGRTLVALAAELPPSTARTATPTTAARPAIRLPTLTAPPELVALPTGCTSAPECDRSSADPTIGHGSGTTGARLDPDRRRPAVAEGLWRIGSDSASPRATVRRSSTRPPRRGRRRCSPAGRALRRRPARPARRRRAGSGAGSSRPRSACRPAAVHRRASRSSARGAPRRPGTGRT